jgi:hypothetical protein
VSFEHAARVADAVLLEGYVLYPYRSTSTKNRYRWTFGVLAPSMWSEAGGCEPWWLSAQVIVEGGGGEVRGRLRFLRVVDRRIEVHERGGMWRAVERLDVDDRSYVSWEEGEVKEVDFTAHLDDEPRTTAVLLPSVEEIEVIADADVRARIVKRRLALAGRIETRAERVSGDLRRLTVRVENLTPFEADAPRAAAVRAGFVSTHLLLAAGDDVRFVSLVDPPAHALAATAACANVGTHPVLAGEPGRRDLLLASPIILPDHPAIAPESPGDFFDACEIDELLALRTRTLTSEEKLVARATDPRAAQIVDRVLALTDDEMARLHGAVRERSTVPVRYRPGTRVRLVPDMRRRRTDAQDALYAGRSATIEAVRADVDGREYLAVTIDDDPAVEMHRAKGRFHYYYPDEVEPL